MTSISILAFLHLSCDPPRASQKVRLDFLTLLRMAVCKFSYPDTEYCHEPCYTDIKAETRLTAHQGKTCRAGQVLHCLSWMHHEAHSLESASVAEIDGVKAATTTRTIVEEKRIVSEDVIWDQICLKEAPNHC